MSARRPPLTPVDPLPLIDEDTAARLRRDRISGTRLTATPKPQRAAAVLPAPPEGERLLAIFAQSLERSTDARTDAELVAIHLNALSDALPGRLLGIRLVTPGTRAVELAQTNVAFMQGADLVLRAETDARKVSLAGGSSGFDLPLVARGSLLGAITVEHPEGPLGAGETALGLQRDRPVATHLARQLTTLLTVGRAQREKNLGRPSSRVVPLTPNDPRGLGNELRAIFDGAREVVAIIDRTGAVRIGNEAFTRIAGCAPERLTGRVLANMVAATERRRLGGAFWAALRGEASQIEVAIESGDGESHPLSLSFSPVRDIGGAVLGVVLIGRETGRQRSMESRFAHADKLATVGRLAASIVHEINNPLAAIMAYADHLSRNVRTGDPRDLARISRISEAAARIQTLVRRLLAYAPSAHEPPATIALGEVVDQATIFCEHVLRERNVGLQRQVAPNTPNVHGVRGELTQVLVNLITNACHAAPDSGGRIDVVVRPLDAQRVRVQVRDNGKGIPSRDLGRIFEPFYTTKASGQGTGLGLTIVRSIVEQHHGEISVDSSPGLGTVFMIDLPVASESATRQG